MNQTNQLSSGTTGIRLRPIKPLTVALEGEIGRADTPFTPLSDRNYHVLGARAQYKGIGTFNGVAGYRFLLTAVDGQVSGGGGVDRFRIKIWHQDPDTQADVVDYDNQLDASTEGTLQEGTAIGGGSIVIHK